MRHSEPSVRVWVVGLDVADDVLNAAHAMLSEDERARRAAARRRRCRALHGCLPGRPPWLARLPASGAGAGPWSIHDVALAPGYVGAVVAEGADVALVTRSLSLGALWTRA
jgi:hypothetical protein